MPHVEVLPNSATAAAPGWTYVVDTGYDPSRVAINPKDRKRAAARTAGRCGDNELTARQQAAIARRIGELDRDNDPKQQIGIPGKSAPAKTANARRILQSARQIKHWLDEEEALVQQGPAPRIAAAAPRTAASTRKLSTVPPTPLEATPGPMSVVLTPRPSTAREEGDLLLLTENSMAPPPSKAELHVLLSALPLSYAESFATLPADHPPQRQFCDNCGYWGKIKCLKCGARICGLECKEAHESTRCLKWA
ncbi:uncharacterized protein BDR25DRAFT_336392 [Lindgomyces ingoldianus]|uniref:Uncharacterized protein n=1 Tax=Lindgomyces ingoldianus TaxID=673940 RepID=A0ACB6QHS4_9PLEO|nr:uncharacterized protein BDR25DRAFT_336392 [Lindgomyces ingoldianus]KAF2466486.1 hypothetical protein BDR25DRAFT_336392 [Lindgomyces ingoldianus]